MSRFPRRELKGNKEEDPQVLMGSFLWRLTRGRSATRDQAPLLCVIAGFLWVLILDMGGGPRQVVCREEEGVCAYGGQPLFPMHRRLLP